MRPQRPKDALRLHVRKGGPLNASFLKGAAVGLSCGLIGGAAVAFAGSGINGVFNLGVSNSVDAKTTLTGATSVTELQVTNTGTGGALGVTSASTRDTGTFTNNGTGRALAAQTAGPVAALFAKSTGGGPAASFAVNAGVAPFAVNSTGRVGGLNADLLDGLDSAAIQKRVTGTCAAGSAVRVVLANGTVTCQSVASGGGPTVLSGVATFVDPLDTSGFIGMDGEANLSPSAAAAGSPVPAAGPLAGFRARLPAAAIGDVVFTLYVNEVATAVTCTIAATQTACADGAHTAALSAGDSIAVGVTNGSGLLRHVRWSARLGA